MPNPKAQLAKDKNHLEVRDGTHTRTIIVVELSLPEAEALALRARAAGVSVQEFIKEILRKS
jgi:hypothetical protein